MPVPPCRWRDERQRTFLQALADARQNGGARGGVRGDHPGGGVPCRHRCRDLGLISPRRPSSPLVAMRFSPAAASTGSVGSRRGSVPAAISPPSPPPNSDPEPVSKRSERHSLPVLPLRPIRPAGNQPNRRQLSLDAPVFDHFRYLHKGNGGRRAVEPGNSLS